VLKSYIEQFEKQFKMPVSGFGGYAYDAMQMLAKALQGSGGDREKIGRLWEKITGHVGISGLSTFRQRTITDWARTPSSWFRSGMASGSCSPPED